MWTSMPVKNFWATVLIKAPHVHGFYIQEPGGEEPRKITSCFWQAEGKSNHLKYTQRTIHIKGEESLLRT